MDAPTQNFGNTNDGNTARKFFNNIELVTRITGNIVILFFSFNQSTNTNNCSLHVHNILYTKILSVEI